MRVNRQVLLAAGLIVVQLCASTFVPSVSFAQSAAPSTIVASTNTQPRATTGYPSWRSYDQNAQAIAVQESVPRKDLGAGISSVQFFRSIGSTVGVALVGTAVTSTFTWTKLAA